MLLPGVKCSILDCLVLLIELYICVLMVVCYSSVHTTVFKLHV